MIVTDPTIAAVARIIWDEPTEHVPMWAVQKAKRIVRLLDPPPYNPPPHPAVRTTDEAWDVIRGIVVECSGDGEHD